MDKQIVEIDMLEIGHGNPAWIAALEAGKVLYFPNFAQHGFAPQKEELALFREDIRDPKIRNISLDPSGALKGVVDSISELSINNVEVEHDRLSSHIPAGTAGVYLSLEMEDKKHAQRLVEFLKQKGIEFKVIS